MQAIKIKVSGRVQGVGFRYHTQHLARRMGMVGWVKNQLDGSVAILAQGSEKDVEMFIQRVKMAPSPYAIITTVEVNETTVDQDLKGFAIH